MLPNRPDEVVDDGVDSLIRQRVLLVQQGPQKDTVCAVVVHLGYFNDGRRRVQQRYRVLGEDASDNRCFSQSAVASLHKSAISIITNYLLFYCPRYHEIPRA